MPLGRALSDLALAREKKKCKSFWTTIMIGTSRTIRTKKVRKMTWTAKMRLRMTKKMIKSNNPTKYTFLLIVSYLKVTNTVLFSAASTVRMSIRSPRPPSRIIWPFMNNPVIEKSRLSATMRSMMKSSWEKKWVAAGMSMRNRFWILRISGVTEL